MHLSPDFIVIGSGIAGLRAAIALAPVGRVLILTKAEPTESNTGYAQGGIAAALGDDDSPALHGADTIKAGDGLCDEDAVRVLVEQGPPYVTELLEWGTRFDRDESGRPARGREAAHTVRRVLHAGDTTGREIGRVLWNRVSALPIGRDGEPRAGHRAARRGRERHRRQVFRSPRVPARRTGAGRRCSPPAAPARSSARRPIRPWRPATASRWRFTRARASPTSSSSSFIRPPSTSEGRRDF